MNKTAMTPQVAIAPIFQALNRLDKQLAILSDVTTDLGSRLSPVTCTEDKPKIEGGLLRESFGNSGICNRICEAADMVDALIKRCQSTANNLEI